MAIVILSVGLLVFFGHFLADFFQRTKVPDVLILMLAGIALGPVSGVVSPADFGKVGPVFTTLALIIILFEGGIHLNVSHLGAAARDTLTISLATFVVTVLLVTHIADLMLPVEFPTAVLIGTVLGGTSSAVVVPLIRVLKMDPTPSTVLFLESALTDVLVIVLALGLLQGLEAQAAGGAGTLDAGRLLGDVGSSFLIAGLIGVAGAFVWSAILDRVREIPHTVFTTFAYVFILFGLAELWGYSGAIASLAFGIAVANFPNIPERLFGKIFSFRLTAFADHERAFFAEAVFLVKTFFFVYLGVSMTFDNLAVVVAGLVLAVTVFVARAPVVRLLGSPNMSRRDAGLMTALVPKGLAAAVLASLTVQAGIADGELVQGTIYAAVFFSILLCAAFVFVLERGMLNRAAASLYGKFALEPSPVPTTGRRDSGLLIEPALIEFASEALEPNPVDLEPRTDPASPEERGRVGTSRGEGS
ncbi:MAG: cation:proton antiporter [Gemmatimonadales bacterium]